MTPVSDVVPVSDVTPVSDAIYQAAARSLFAKRPDRLVPGLSRIAAVCASLGQPQQRYPAVHITGTNGKTSLARMVTSLLRAHGARVGTYTSPHLQDVRERLCLDAAPISRADFVATLEMVRPHLRAVEERRGEMVTFFETLTAMACLAFAKARVDAGVFEVGMGGRLDATNLVDGRVAVINGVALDHPELGATVEAVAREKAGIIKDGAAVVSAVQVPAAAHVIAEVTAERGATLRLAGRDFGVVSRTATAGGQDLVLRRAAGHMVAAHLPLHGAHQAANAACALAAAESFLGPGELEDHRIRAGFAQVRSPGRLEVFALPGVAPVVLDGAHNPAGAHSLAAALRSDFGGRRRIVVLGVLGDKDVEAIVAEILSVADEVVVTQPSCGRAAPPDRLAKAALLQGRTVVPVDDVSTALATARGMAEPDDLVVVTGSLYTVGEARAALAS
ncbi:MAG: bifunctional folylpolyglutamate synthase/dihydrofolate synthase [Actinomycetota bacterium]|nr:bifunctional folylpolyglutamate synthase/dihydrofolate synthase [Actinomycetota bacterium]